MCKRLESETSYGRKVDADLLICNSFSCLSLCIQICNRLTSEKTSSNRDPTYCPCYVANFWSNKCKTCGYIGVIKSPRIPALCPEQDWSNLRQSIFFFIQIWRICYALQIVFSNESCSSDNLRERSIRKSKEKI